MSLVSAELIALAECAELCTFFYCSFTHYDNKRHLMLARSHSVYTFVYTFATHATAALWCRRENATVYYIAYSRTLSCMRMCIVCASLYAHIVISVAAPPLCVTMRMLYVCARYMFFDVQRELYKH